MALCKMKALISKIDVIKGLIETATWKPKEVFCYALLIKDKSYFEAMNIELNFCHIQPYI